MFKLLPIIVVIAMAGIAYYAWQQYQGIQRQLVELEKSGIDISYQLASRPAVVFDDKKARIYLAHADRIDEIYIDGVREVVIFRAQRNAELERQDETVTSHGQIVDKQGVIYRFDDYDTAEEAVKYFRDIPSLGDKVRLVNTK